MLDMTQPQITDGIVYIDICNSPTAWLVEWWDSTRGVLVNTTIGIFPHFCVWC